MKNKRVKCKKTMLLISLILVCLTGCAEYAELPAGWKITQEPIPKEELPKVDFKTTFGYAIFEGVLSKVQRQNGQFSINSLEGERLFPSESKPRVSLCWSRTMHFSRDYASLISGSTPKSKSNVSMTSDVNREYPSDAVAHIGDLYLNENQRCPFYVMQYQNRISFSSFQDIPYAANYQFDKDGSYPLLFHNRMIRVSKQRGEILFLDAETGEVLQSSENTAGWLVAAGVIGSGDESLLVVIKSVAPYVPESEIWFFNSDFLRIKDKTLPLKLKSRNWSVFTKSTTPNALFLYKTFCDSQITEGYKIILNTGK